MEKIVHFIYCKSASTDLCHSLALVARCLCSTYANPKGIAPILACHLIALDKNPGVRPIEISDIARRILSKAILTLTRDDIHETVSADQLCGGKVAGIKGAIHSTRSLFTQNNTEAILLVDTLNAELFCDGQTLWSQEGTA